MNARVAACLLALAAPAAHACSCGNTTPERVFDESLQVIAAEIVAVEDVGAKAERAPADGFHPGRNYGLRATFRLVESFKGDATQLEALGTGYVGGDCGLSLEPGHTYLFNVRANGVVGACGIVREIGAGNCAWPATAETLRARSRDGATKLAIPTSDVLFAAGDCR